MCYLQGLVFRILFTGVKFRVTGWTEGPSLPEPRKLHCVVQIDDNKVLLAGGIMKRSISKITKSTVLVKLNTRNMRNSRNYQKVGNLRKERQNHTCALFNNKVYLVAGGETEIFDLETEKWTLGETFPGQISKSGSLAEYQEGLFYSDEDNFFKLSKEGIKV